MDKNVVEVEQKLILLVCHP